MRKYLTIILLFFTLATSAKNYYIANAGNDLNSVTDAQDPATPWKTIAKLNSFWPSIVAGDSILFNRGDLFYGSIVVTKSGLAAKPIVISAYGTGAKPVISGFTTLSGWTNTSGNIWECTPAVALKKNVNIFTIDGVPYAVGRTPNSGYYVYQSADTTHITSATLTGTPNYVGAEAVIKKTSYTMERGMITAQSGSTITIKKTQAIDNGLFSGYTPGTNNYGLFLQRFAGSLDQQGEWFFDSTANKMKLYSTVNPSTFVIKASAIDTLILLGNRTSITITNLSIEGGGMYGVESNGGNTITVNNCDFNNNTKALYVWNSDDALVDHNSFNNSFNGAVLVSNNQRKRIIITNNLVRNTGQLPGMGVYWSNNNFKGIVARTDSSTVSNYVKVIGNKLYNTGHAPIEFQGSNVIIRRNVVDTFCNTLDDNGGIYTFVNNTSLNHILYTNRLIDSNFISNAIGAPAGANNTIDVAGYYMDDQTCNVTGLYNTIYNIPGNGVQMNNNVNSIFNNNLIYNCSMAIAIGQKPFSRVSGIVIKNNTIYQKDSTQFNFFHTNSNLQLPTAITIAQSLTNLWVMDSNCITNLKYQGYGYYYSTNGSSFVFPPGLTKAVWQSTYLHDQHSIAPPIAVTATNTQLFTNYGDTARALSLPGARYWDAKGNQYDNGATVPRGSGLVLIRDTATPVSNMPPVAKAGKDQTVLLPVDITTLVGSGTDSDGSISGYSWAIIEGPGGATLGTANAATTTLRNLQQGIYKIELTVTDDDGATSKDIVQVEVKPTAVVQAIFIYGYRF